MSFLSRRGFVSALGTSALLGPLRRMDALGAATSPRRLVCIYTPNGIHGESGRCKTTLNADGSVGGPASGSEHDFQFGPYYQPLNEVKDNTIVLSRLTWAGPEGWGHAGGSRGPFTAWKTDTDRDFPKVPSVDQWLGAELFKRGQTTPKRNLHYAIGGVGSSTWAPFWSAPEVVAVPSQDPAKAFEDLFAGFTDAGTGSRTIEGRRRVLDQAIADCERLFKQAGPDGRNVLELQCANLRAMKNALAAPGQNAPSCRWPKDRADALAAINYKDPNNYPAVTEFFFDLITTALACDLTRTTAFMFGGGAARLRLPFLGLKAAKQVDGYTADDHHTWTHHSGGEAEKTAALTTINQWYSAMVVKLLRKLAATKDAYGQPLIDSTAVLWLNEYGTGCQTGHDLINIPGFLFTGKNEIKTNRYLRLNHKYAEHKALLTSMIHFMGLRDVRDYGFNGPLKSYDHSGTGPSIQNSEGPLASLYG
jgi:hypothetical protein